MALSGWSTSNYLQTSNAAITGGTFTFSGWFYIASAPAAASNLVNVTASANTTNRYSFFISTAQKMTFNANGSSALQIVGATNVPLNQWNHFACVQRADNDRELYLNGVSDGTSSTNVTTSGINQTSIGVRGGSSNANAYTGYAAEICIRNINLTLSQIKMEAKGFAAYLIAPQNIKAYYPLLNTTAPGNNIFSSFNLALTGSLTKQNHPRIYY